MGGLMWISRNSSSLCRKTWILSIRMSSMISHVEVKSRFQSHNVRVVGWMLKSMNIFSTNYWSMGLLWMDDDDKRDLFFGFWIRSLSKLTDRHTDDENEGFLRCRDVCRLSHVRFYPFMRKEHTRLARRVGHLASWCHRLTQITVPLP